MKKNTNYKMKNPAGDMLLEIQEQDLSAPIGGTANVNQESMVSPIVSIETNSVLSIIFDPKHTRMYICDERPTTVRTNCY
jgi:hypothetical protein